MLLPGWVLVSKFGVASSLDDIQDVLGLPVVFDSREDAQTVADELFSFDFPVVVVRLMEIESSLRNLLRDPAIIAKMKAFYAQPAEEKS